MLVDFDYIIERYDASKEQSARSILRSFYKLSHRLEKAVESFETAIADLNEVDAEKAKLLLDSWGDGGKIIECCKRMNKAVTTLLDSERS